MATVNYSTNGTSYHFYGKNVWCRFDETSFSNETIYKYAHLAWFVQLVHLMNCVGTSSPTGSARVNKLDGPVVITWVRTLTDDYDSVIIHVHK